MILIKQTCASLAACSRVKEPWQRGPPSSALAQEPPVDSIQRPSGCTWMNKGLITSNAIRAQASKILKSITKGTGTKRQDFKTGPVCHISTFCLYVLSPLIKNPRVDFVYRNKFKNQATRLTFHSSSLD